MLVPMAIRASPDTQNVVRTKCIENIVDRLVDVVWFPPLYMGHSPGVWEVYKVEQNPVSPVAESAPDLD